MLLKIYEPQDGRGKIWRYDGFKGGWAEYGGLGQEVGVCRESANPTKVMPNYTT